MFIYIYIYIYMHTHTHTYHKMKKNLVPIKKLFTVYEINSYKKTWVSDTTIQREGYYWEFVFDR